MDQITRVEIVGGFLQQAQRAASLYARQTPWPSEANDKFPSLRSRDSTEDRNFQKLAQWFWPNTFGLDCTVLRQPIGPVTQQNSFEAYLGRPMEQTVPGTCALVSCTVCVEAVHRLKYEKFYGLGTFPWAAAPCEQLTGASILDDVWVADRGAKVGAVLTRVKDLGGVPATTAAPNPALCLLPLGSWEVHHSGAGLTPRRVAELLDSHGPCVATLWVLPSYHDFDAGRDDALVYRGCGRSADDRRESLRLYGDVGVGWHAVVCFAYRILGDGQMHVKVLDNHGPTGPRRWVDVEELHTLYTLSVERLDAPLHQGDR